MKKFLILIAFLLPVFVFAAGAGGGGSTGSGEVSGDTIPPVIVPAPVTPPVVVEEKKEPATTLKALPPLRTHFCFTVPKLQQRIECRLGLGEAELTAEYAKQYLPEECRALPKKQQADCVTRYRALQPCWAKPVGDDRISCAKKVLGFPENLSDVKKECVARTIKKEKTQCLASLQQQTYNLVKFRFYDLNERAEGFLKENPMQDGRPGIQFIVTSELNKQKFNNARTKVQRLQIIKNERAAWQRFVKAAHLKNTEDFLDSATKELTIVE